MNALVSFLHELPENVLKVFSAIYDSVRTNSNNDKWFAPKSYLVKETGLSLPTIRKCVQELIEKGFISRTYACKTCHHEYGIDYKSIDDRHCPTCGQYRDNTIWSLYEICLRGKQLLPILRCTFQYMDTVSEGEQMIPIGEDKPTGLVNKETFLHASREHLQIYAMPKLKELSRYIGRFWDLRDTQEWIKALALIVGKRFYKPEEVIRSPWCLFNWAFQELNRQVKEKSKSDNDTIQYVSDVIDLQLSNLTSCPPLSSSWLYYYNDIRELLQANPINGVNILKEKLSEKQVQSPEMLLLYIV